MGLYFHIALRHLLARKRQSLVSLMGIVLGVAFFLAISSLMQGSENDFIRRLVDNSPHITLQDEYRTPRTQPITRLYPTGAVQLKHVTPLPENRGIRSYQKVLVNIRAVGGITASPVLTGQGLLTVAGEQVGVSLNGMIPSEIKTVTTISSNMTEGTIDTLESNADGIILGASLKKTYGLYMGDTLPVTAAGGTRTFRIIGFFSTGRESYDKSQAFISLSRAQTLLNKPNRVNSIIMKLTNPTDAQTVATQLEGMVGYKAVSWQEASSDIMNTLRIRNIIMYTVVSSVLLVAAFGIYNVISTVVMEKQRDIAILKAMGFEAYEIRRIFTWQGFLLGCAGAALGLPLGMVFMRILMMVHLKAPGSTEVVQMPLDWSLPQFLIAGGFALFAAMLAAFLPARKGAHVQPVDILRGGM